MAIYRCVATSFLVNLRQTRRAGEAPRACTPEVHRRYTGCTTGNSLVPPGTFVYLRCTSGVPPVYFRCTSSDHLGAVGLVAGRYGRGQRLGLVLWQLALSPGADGAGLFTLGFYLPENAQARFKARARSQFGGGAGGETS